MTTVFEILPEPVNAHVHPRCSMCGRRYSITQLRRLPLFGVAEQAGDEETELRECFCDNRVPLRVRKWRAS